MWGPDAAGFFEAAAQGLLELYGAQAPEGNEEKTITLQADTAEEILVSWLNEIIFLVSARHWMPRAARVVKAGEKTLEATLEGAAIAENNSPASEIKAATYGNLSIRRGADDSYEATVILDV